MYSAERLDGRLKSQNSNELKANFFWASRTASRSETAEARKNSPASIGLISTEKPTPCVFPETGREVILERFPSFPRRNQTGTESCPQMA
jgi:hypothetical protein